MAARQRQLCLESFVCSHCEKEKFRTAGDFLSGYGLDRDNNKVCYACIAEQDRLGIETGQPVALYLTKTCLEKPDPNACGMRSYGSYKWEVTNWPGTLRFRAGAKEGRHNMGGKRYDVWFRDHLGRPWWGYCVGQSQYLHCRQITEKSYGR